MAGGRPPSTRLVAWGNAYLLGWTSLDDAAERVVGRQGHQRVDGLPGGGDVSMAVALGLLAQRGARALRLALPVAGDVSGLPGPAAFNAAALAAGEAVLCDGSPAGLVPEADSTGAVRWTYLETTGRTPPGATLSEADRGLATAVREATAALSSLDVAGAAVDAGPQLARIREGGQGSALPSQYPARAHELLDRANRLAAILDLAGADDGTAYSAGAIRARRRELDVLAAAVRQAIAASYNAPAESVSRGMEGGRPPAG